MNNALGKNRRILENFFSVNEETYKGTGKNYFIMGFSSNILLVPTPIKKAIPISVVMNADFFVRNDWFLIVKERRSESKLPQYIFNLGLPVNFMTIVSLLKAAFH